MFPKNVHARLIRLGGSDKESADILFEGPLEKLMLRAGEEAARDAEALRVEIGGTRHKLIEIALL